MFKSKTPPPTETVEDKTETAPAVMSPVSNVTYLWTSATHTCMAVAPTVDDARELCAPGWTERVRQYDAAVTHSGGAINPNLLDNALRQDPRIVEGPIGVSVEAHDDKVSVR